jgi:kynurenine formamidase
MVIKLSHNLSESTPFYSALPGPRLDRLYDLAKGDGCNSFYLTTSNHAGTHVDGPFHFNPKGRKISEYDMSELIFTKTAVMDIQVSPDELILPEHLEASSACRKDCDLLILRSGFGKYRTDAKMYVDHSPGFSKAAADFLMRQFSDLKALAVDFVSIAAMSHMEEGCEAHRVFLGCEEYSSRPILLIEDTNLPNALPELDKVYVVPWLFDGLDSAPCVIFAECNTESG